jgi:hypothetical protein
MCRCLHSKQPYKQLFFSTVALLIQDTSSSTHNLTIQCSAFQLPVLLTSLHKPLLEQDRFKGWLDLDLLHSLHEGQKKDINNLQKQFRIKVTAFDELLQ